MLIQYVRGEYVIGGLPMKALEQARLVVVDSEDYLSFTDRQKQLEASLQEMITLNAGLTKALEEAQQTQREASYRFISQSAPATTSDVVSAGTIISVRLVGKRRPNHNRKKGAI